MRAVRFAIFASFLGAAVLPTAAFAHPHVAGDPFADVGDTLAAGSAQLRPLTARHERWTVHTLRDGFPEPEGTLELRVTRDDSPAGRRWCVVLDRRDQAGAPMALDSVWVSAGAPIPIDWVSTIGGDSLDLGFDGRAVSGWKTNADGRIDGAARTAVACFPAALDRVLVEQAPLRAGAACALAFYEPRGLRAGERRLAVHVVGETPLDRKGRARRCWLLGVFSDEATGESRTLWIDAATRALLKEEIRDASGDLRQVLEAE